MTGNLYIILLRLAVRLPVRLFHVFFKTADRIEMEFYTDLSNDDAQYTEKD